MLITSWILESGLLIFPPTPSALYLTQGYHQRHVCHEAPDAQFRELKGQLHRQQILPE
jgi:hypothetical protein